MATAVCFEQDGSVHHRPVGCDRCRRLILRHEPRIAWLPDSQALEYDNPPWGYRHVTCGSPCDERTLS